MSVAQYERQRNERYQTPTPEPVPRQKHRLRNTEGSYSLNNEIDFRDKSLEVSTHSNQRGRINNIPITSTTVSKPVKANRLVKQLTHSRSLSSRPGIFPVTSSKSSSNKAHHLDRWLTEQREQRDQDQGRMSGSGRYNGGYENNNTYEYDGAYSPAMTNKWSHSRRHRSSSYNRRSHNDDLGDEMRFDGQPISNRALNGNERASLRRSRTLSSSKRYDGDHRSVKPVNKPYLTNMSSGRSNHSNTLDSSRRKHRKLLSVASKRSASSLSRRNNGSRSSHHQYPISNRPPKKRSGVVIETMSAPNPFCPDIKGLCCLMVLLNLALFLIAIGFIIVLQLHEPYYVWNIGIVVLVCGFLTIFITLLFCICICQDSDWRREMRRRNSSGSSIDGTNSAPGLYWTKHWHKSIEFPQFGGTNNNNKQTITTTVDQHEAVDPVTPNNTLPRPRQTPQYSNTFGGRGGGRSDNNDSVV